MKAQYIYDIIYILQDEVINSMSVIAVKHQHHVLHNTCQYCGSDFQQGTIMATHSTNKRAAQMFQFKIKVGSTTNIMRSDKLEVVNLLSVPPLKLNK